MNPVGGATIRGDINTFVEEAAQSDSWRIGTIVFPPLMVEKKSGSYPKIQKAAGDLLAAGATLRRPKGGYARMNRQWTNDTYDTQDRGLEELVDDSEKRDLSRFFDVETLTAKLVLRNILLDHEIRVAAELFNTTNFGTATNSSVAYTTANLATINAISDILAAIERVNDNGEAANTIVMSANVWNRIRLATLTQNFLRGSRPNDATLNVTPNDLASSLAPNGIEQVLIGRSRYNGATKGQAYSATKVWSDTYIWVGQVESGDYKAGGAGRTLVWNEEGGFFVTETYRSEENRSNVVRVRQNTAEKVINGASGTLIGTQYS